MHVYMTRNNETDYNENASSKSIFKSSCIQIGASDNLPSLSLDARDRGKALSQIDETKESSRLNVQIGGAPWAITQQYPAQHQDKQKSSFTGLRVAPVVHTKTSSFLHDLEKRFPKLEMPKLHCFTMSLGPKPPDPEEVRHEVHLHQLERNRKSYTHRLTKMHQLAMANAAASKRILEMHDDFDFIINGAPLQDLISDQHFYTGLPDKKAEDKTLASVVIESPSISQLHHGLDSRAVASVTQSQPSSAGTRKRSSGIKSKKAHRDHNKSDAGDIKKLPVKRVPPAPLTMREIKENTRVMSAKCLSSMWINYTNQGVVSLNKSQV